MARVHWPKGITAGGAVRDQYAHAIDMVPTVLDVLGIEPPATIRGVPRSPLHGVSLAQTFEDAAAPSNRTTQYFEMMGHRSIYHDGWRAVCPWPGPSFTEAGQGSASRSPLSSADRFPVGAGSPVPIWDASERGWRRRAADSASARPPRKRP